jgi:hypothetical protein
MVTQLVSPGVSVSVIDESAYAPAGRGTTPLLIIATQQDKTLPNAGGIAPGTTKAQAGVLQLVGSQRELVNLFGSPIFYQNQAGELNEYGLFTAYQYLNQAGPAYILRADIDLKTLLPTQLAPRSLPTNGTYWLDLSTTQFGVFKSNGNTNPGRAWDVVNLISITDNVLADGNNIPLGTVGVNGDYAIVAYVADNKLYEKINGSWYQVGSSSWLAQHPVIVSGTAPTDALNAITDTSAQISINGTLVGGPFSGPSMTNIYNDIHAALLTANSPVSVTLFGNVLTFTNAAGGDIILNDVVGIALSQLGFVSTTFKGNQMYYATHTRVPTGSVAGDVWVKTTNPNAGASWVIKYYSSATNQWTTLEAPLFQNDATANSYFGTNINVGTLYVNYNYYATSPAEGSFFIKRYNGTAWAPLAYEASSIEPSGEPAAGTLWYNNNYLTDLLVNDGQRWVGYNVFYPHAEVIKADLIAPTLHLDGSSLVDNDIWIDTGDNSYPKMYRWNALVKQWEQIDTTDRTTPLGVLFGDARADSGPTPITIGSTIYTHSTDENVLAKSVHVDPDVPNPLDYPAGMILFNTRFSTNVVKQWKPNWLIDYINEPYMVGEVTFPSSTITDAGRWVCSTTFDDLTLLTSDTLTRHVAGVHTPFGYKAQRAVVVQQLQKVVAGNDAIRAENIFFNLVSCPGYHELLDELIVLNTDMGEIAFIVSDTPARLAPTTASITNWSQNKSLQATNSEEGLATQSYPYAGIYYPWGMATNPTDGANVMIPASTIALMTMLYNDAVAYPWSAPAGQNRGLVTVATTVGYLTAANDYQALILNKRQRDTLYLNRINPIAYDPTVGLMVYGEKTLHGFSTALDRINVARLINYMRYQSDRIARQFLFEPNDEYTREHVRLTFNRFLDNLVSLRALYDYACVCDGSNNTPERIDRNELWIDIAIHPVKTVEFIYIPIRILNTSTPLA